MTIAVDFDGVIHAYSKGWQDGTIYDPPIEGALEALRELMDQHPVAIFTTRNAVSVASWMEGFGFDARVDASSAAMTFWNERGQLLVTNKKIPALAYIDDRGIRFENWEQTLADLAALRFIDREGE